MLKSTLLSKIHSFPRLHLMIPILHTALALQFVLLHSFTSVKFEATNSIGKTPERVTNLIIFSVEIYFFSFHSLFCQLVLGLWSRFLSQVCPSPEYFRVYICRYSFRNPWYCCTQHQHHNWMFPRYTRLYLQDSTSLM